MMMSVWRKRPDRASHRAELDHLACISMAVGPDDINMITWSLGSNRAALVGLGEATSIVKPLEDGDDKLSFDDLFDSALSMREYRRLKEHGVADTSELKDKLYRVTLVANLMAMPQASCLIKAKDDVDLGKKLTELVHHNDDFSRELFLKIMEYMMTSGIARFATTGGTVANDPAPDDAPAFEFLTHPE